jgi:hypothetical protein
MNKLPARTGIVWLKQGFSLFRQQPFLLTTLLFLQFIGLLLLAPVPLIGQVAPAILLPAFIISIQQACHLIDEGKPVGIGVVLTGFRKDAIGPLCKLGAVYLIVTVGISLAMSPWIDLAVLEEAAKNFRAANGARPATVEPALASAVMSYMLMTLLVTLALLLLSFAPGVTYWKKMPTFKAIFYSVFAVFGALGPVLVMLLTMIGISMALMMVMTLLLGQTPILPLAIVWFSLILGLVVQCALYMAYKQIMGAPETDAPRK